MPLIPEIHQRKLLKLLKRKGLRVEVKKGKGSHAKVYASNGKWTIIPSRIRKRGTRAAIAKFLLENGYSIDDIK